MNKKRLIAIVSPPYTIEATSAQASKKEIEKRIAKGIKGAVITEDGKYKTGSGKFMEKYSENPQNIGNLKDSKMVGVVSPPYSNRLANEAQTEEQHKKWHRIAWEKRNFTLYSLNPENIGNIRDDLKTEQSFDITQFHNCSEDLEWFNLYGSDIQFKKFINNETFAHPAKMSMLLCDRIFKHLKKLGLLKQNDVICDFMAGSGRTNLMASLHGFDSIAVELEPHFIKMINQNKEQFEKLTGKKANWQVIQGDSRKLSELLNGSMVGIVSPPYKDALSSGQSGIDWNKKQGSNYYQKGNPKGIMNYNPDNPSNIGNLKDKQIVGITSPPFEEALSYTSDKYEPDKYPFVKGRKQFNQETGQPQKYGITNGNLGNQQGESYLSAMLQVYKEASKLMPIIVTVTKNPTRKGKLRRLDLDTAKLLMMSGYQIVDYHRAILFTEDKQKTLTGLTKKEVKGRLSFFKRLSMQKGNVVAQWEDVLIGVRMNLLNDKNMIAITSPSYSAELSGGMKNKSKWFKKHPEIMQRGGGIVRGELEFYNNPSNIGNLPDKPIKEVKK